MFLNLKQMKYMLTILPLALVENCGCLTMGQIERADNNLPPRIVNGEGGSASNIRILEMLPVDN